MDIMRAFIGIDAFKILGNAHDMISVRDPIAPMHISGNTRDFQRLAAIVALHLADGRWSDLTLIEQTTQLHRSKQAQCDFSLHVG